MYIHQLCLNILTASLCVTIIHIILNRVTAATKMNDTSSRSHAIFTITFTQVCEHAHKLYWLSHDHNHLPLEHNYDHGEGRVRKSVCCVGMSVKVLVIHCGIVQHIHVLELNFW